MSEVDRAARPQRCLRPGRPLPRIDPRRLRFPELGGRHDRAGRRLQTAARLEERWTDDAMLSPDELRGLVRLVDDRSFEHELGPAQAHHPLEPERRLPAACPQPHGVLGELVLPGKRRHLAVKGNRTAPVPARFVDAREQLLPAPLVVPHDLVVAAPLQRRRARRLEPPRALEENVHSRAQVGELVDVGALLGQDRHPQCVVRKDQAPPAADRACRDARHPPGGSSPGCTSSPSAHSRPSGRCR